MSEWRIYYGDGSIAVGVTERDWTVAPSSGVQVVALLAPRSEGWTYPTADGRNHPVTDRQLWTGEDEFDPFGWGAKFGSWLTDAEYAAVWFRACSD